MKNNNLILIIIAIISVMFLLLNSCKSSAVMSSKSGAQLWGETCLRCHNPPSPETFSDTEWEVAATHMQIRGNLTPEEVHKVVLFLKSAN